MGCLSLGGGLDREKWEKHSKSLIREVRGSGWFPRKVQGQRPEGRAKGASGCGPKTGVSHRADVAASEVPHSQPAWTAFLS